MTKLEFVEIEKGVYVLKSELEKTVFTVTIKTKRFLRKPKVETFSGRWKSEEHVKYIVNRFRPKAKILKIVKKNNKIGKK